MDQSTVRPFTLPLVLDKSQVHSFSLPPVEMESSLIDKLLTHPYCYDQRLVYAILEDQETRLLHSPIDYLQLTGRYSIKIEGMERFSPEFHDACRTLAAMCYHLGPVTCHLFKAGVGSPSFPMHVDPDDVVLQVLDGQKDMVINDELVALVPGESWFIPRGTLHQALNAEASVMLSFGLEQYGLDKM